MSKKSEVKRVRRPADYQLHTVMDYDEVHAVYLALSYYLDSYPEDSKDKVVFVGLFENFQRALEELDKRLKKESEG